MTAETRLLEPVTASDLFLLLWDDYGWSTDIGGLAILDGDGRVRIDESAGSSNRDCTWSPPLPAAAVPARLGLDWPL